MRGGEALAARFPQTCPCDPEIGLVATVSVQELFSLKNKVAVVTGGNRGIGRAIVRAFAEAGAAVVVAARDEAASALLIDELTADGTVAIAVRTDVTSREDLENMVQEVSNQLGPVDVLVNNAGFGIESTALELPDAEWDRVLSTNLDAVWRASQIVGAGMVRAGHGSIINIGSISGFIVNRPQWHAPYGVAKAAVHHLTKSLAAEWASSGVRVNAIAPGFVRTTNTRLDDPIYRHYWSDEVPMQRLAEPEEIAPTALYLATDASSFVTGAVILVDGGYTLW